MIRLLDILFSLIGIIILSPVYILISISLLIDPTGNILFRQIRIGKAGKEFTIYKFRTMVNTQNSNLQLTLINVSRITKLGAFLRKWKLDEIPQLFNVLKGDMSIVGPRPEVLDYVKLYSEKEKEILTVKPGITDYASIEFSNEETILEKSDDPEKFYIESILPKKIELNMKYINNRSLKNYLRIICLTIKTILK